MHTAKNFCRNYSIMIPMPMLLNPLHFLSKNDDGYVDEALLVLLLQIIFCYVTLLVSLIILCTQPLNFYLAFLASHSCTATILFIIYTLHSFNRFYIEPLRRFLLKIFHFIPGLKPGAIDILSLRDKRNLNKQKNLLPKSPL